MSAIADGWNWLEKPCYFCAEFLYNKSYILLLLLLLRMDELSIGFTKFSKNYNGFESSPHFGTEMEVRKTHDDVAI